MSNKNLKEQYIFFQLENKINIAEAISVGLQEKKRIMSKSGGDYHLYYFQMKR